MIEFESKLVDKELILPYIITRRYRSMIEYILEDYTEEEINRCKAYINFNMDIPMRLTKKI